MIKFWKNHSSLDLNYYLNKKVNTYKLAGISSRSNEVGVRYYDELCKFDQYDQLYSGMLYIRTTLELDEKN